MKTIFASALLLAALISPAPALVLLSEPQALKTVFPDADSVRQEKLTFDPDQMAAAKSRLGGKWFLYQSKDLEESPEVAFYFALSGGKKTGVAAMETQSGKHGPVKYVVALDLEGKVTNVAVMMMAEQRGKPISTKRFLSQFVGKTAANPVMVGKDIDAVSGATISSRATAFAVKKVITLYETAYAGVKQE
jgi:Na+-translocating ferredoxin:NAD+ oxidoreductase RnfG subunit